MMKPRRYVLRMTLFLIVVAALIVFLLPGLQHAFLANPGLNGLICGVFLLGVIFSFRQVIRLDREVRWIEHFRDQDKPLSQAPPPRLLAPMAAMLGDRKGRLMLSATAMRSVLDGIGSRLSESRELSLYIIGLLVFLGLLGTFWGLSQTIGSIGEVIRGLSVGGGDFASVFEELKRGLGLPLAGMGTAFSTSLFGLAGSLVLGFLDLQAGQAQNRFYNDLEDWLSGVTRLSVGATSGDGEQPMPIYVQALLEQTADSLDALQRTLQRGEEARAATNGHLLQLSEKIEALTDHLRASQALTLRLAEAQTDLRPVLARLSEAAGSNVIDEATRSHIRNIDVYVARLIEEMAAGREEIIRQVRGDIKLLARTVASLSQETAR